MSEKTLLFVAKTFSGLEEVLAAELKALGASSVKTGKRAVSFRGDQAMMMKANLWSRTSLNILWQIHAFEFHDKDSFYDGLHQIAWEELFDVNQTISVQAVAFRSELFRNTMFLGQLTKDAVVDHFREQTGHRPDVSSRAAQIKIHVHVNENSCSVSLDSSGDPLFKRGYRREGGIAPLNEILAAGLILLSGWDMQSTFIDPMCGSGTFSIEAALLASNVAPGLMRKSFGFANWKGFDQEMYTNICEEAKQLQKPLQAEIIASDLNIKNLDQARQNLMEAGFLGKIRVQRNDFFSFHPPATNGWVLINPPYGHRIQQIELPAFYKNIGDTLKQYYHGYKAGIISQEINRLRHIGLKPAKKNKVYNGPLECVFIMYDLFQGSHKEHVVAVRKKRPRL